MQVLLIAGLCYRSARSSPPGPSDHHPHRCGGSLLLLHLSFCGLPGGLTGGRRGVWQTEQVTATAADSAGAGSNHNCTAMVFNLRHDDFNPFLGCRLWRRAWYRSAVNLVSVSFLNRLLTGNKLLHLFFFFCCGHSQPSRYSILQSLSLAVYFYCSKRIVQGRNLIHLALSMPVYSASMCCLHVFS